MKLILHKPEQIISGNILLPGSKSISNRVLIIKALSGLNFDIENLSDSDDTTHLKDALESYSDNSVIDVYINALRKKLDEPNLPSLITTIRGVGYKIESE